VGNKMDERTQFANKAEYTSEDIRTYRLIEDAKEILRDYDSYFVWERPCCKSLPGNTIVCHEVDLFELYICVVMRELRHGWVVKNVGWEKIEIEGETVVYPYIEEIWNTVVKEYNDKICSKKDNNCIFCHKLERCGRKRRSVIKETGAESDLICYINSEETRIKKYNELIAFLCVSFKNIYDRIDEGIKSTGALNSVQKSLNNMLDDYYNKKADSEIVKKMKNIAEKKRRKILERILPDGNNFKVDHTSFWDRIAVCSDWDVLYKEKDRKDHNYENDRE